MTPPPKCCNPFNKKGHSSVKNKLILISEQYNKRFSSLFGSYVCTSCQVQLYRKNNSVEFKQDKQSNNQDKNNIYSKNHNNKVEQEEDEDEEKEIIESIISTKDPDFRCKSVDRQNRKSKLVETLQEAILAPPEKKRNLNLSNEDCEILKKAISCSNLDALSDVQGLSWVTELKEALSCASTRNQKKVLLTTLPVNWSVRKTAKEFGVSRRMVSAALALKTEKGYCAQPEKKKGKSMSLDLIESVEKFFFSDDVSRVMPGMKDFKSVKIDGKREHKTVSIFT